MAVRGECCVSGSNCMVADDTIVRAECFGCGQPVCTACSRRINYLIYGTQRVCFGCIEERAQNGTEYVEAVYAKEAGYQVTIPRLNWERIKKVKPAIEVLQKNNTILEWALETAGVVQKGHFVLSSGRHTNIYFEKFRLLEDPSLLASLCLGIADYFRGEVDLVVGTATGGMLVAYEVARQLGIPARYVEMVGGKKVLRRGATIPKEARVLVVDDVLTTGQSIMDVLDVIDQGILGGVAVLIDRSEEPNSFGLRCHAVYKIQAESWDPKEIPSWLAKIPITKK